jgi:hypothetical protein
MAMARFYGEVRGSAASPASRVAHQRIDGTLSGWDIGAEITLFVNEDGQTEEEAKKKQLSLARRALQRRFQSAHDDADTKAIQLEGKIDMMFDAIRKAPVNGSNSFDVNLYLSYRAEIGNYLGMRDALREEYQRLFGEPLPTI